MKRLQVFLSPTVLRILRNLTTLLMSVSFAVPIFDEPPEADGLGAWGLLLHIVLAWNCTDQLIHEAYRPPSLSTFSAFNLIFCVFGMIEPISLLGYAMLQLLTDLYTKSWQWRLRLRLGLLGLSWSFVIFMRFFKSASIIIWEWSFGILVAALVFATLWECLNYVVLHRRNKAISRKETT